MGAHDGEGVNDMYEGRVIVHPSGKIELDYFSVNEFRRRPKDGGDCNMPMSWDEWMLAYRPGCSVVKMKLVRCDHDG